MSRVLIFSFILLNITNLRSQIKVAVLDFENTSTIEKYDGFGKAMSNMLLTDLKNNIHPRKISFLERSQLNKILNEQQLQNTKNFDKNTAVTFGKLAGVKYVILGGVYVLDGVCNLNSRMVDVESSEIIYAKESNGKITDWLNLKTKLAEELSSELNNPIQIEEEYTNVEVNEGTISQYSKVIELLESGELEEASKLLSVLTSIQPDFKYLDELKFDIEQLKEQVKNNTIDIENLKQSGGLVYDLNTIQEYKNNIESQLTDYLKKNKLKRELIRKFEIEEITNDKLISSHFLIGDYEIKNKDFINVIDNDIQFLNELIDKKKKEYYIELIIYRIHKKALRYENHENQNDNLKLDLYKKYKSLVNELYDLKKLNELISKEDFFHLYFFRLFIVNPKSNENSKELYLSEINFISNRIKLSNNNQLKEYNFNFEKINELTNLQWDDEFMGWNVHNFIKFFIYREIINNLNPDIIILKDNKLNLSYVFDGMNQLIDIVELEINEKLFTQYKELINEQFLNGFNGFLMSNPFEPISSLPGLTKSIISDFYKVGIFNLNNK